MKTRQDYERPVMYVHIVYVEKGFVVSGENTEDFGDDGGGASPL